MDRDGLVLWLRGVALGLVIGSLLTPHPNPLTPIGVSLLVLALALDRWHADG